MEARRLGRKHEEQRLARLIAGKGIGIQKRRYGHIPAIRPSLEELRASVVAPASEGGLQAVEVQWEEE
eukprot:10755542-Lingulodinium_polyedra.AAC.1